jgi:hypothetical protein
VINGAMPFISNDRDDWLRESRLKHICRAPKGGAMTPALAKPDFVRQPRLCDAVSCPCDRRDARCFRTSL